MVYLKVENLLAYFFLTVVLISADEDKEQYKQTFVQRHTHLKTINKHYFHPTKYSTLIDVSPPDGILNSKIAYSTDLIFPTSFNPSKPKEQHSSLFSRSHDHVHYDTSFGDSPFFDILSTEDNTHILRAPPLNYKTKETKFHTYLQNNNKDYQINDMDNYHTKYKDLLDIDQDNLDDTAADRPKLQNFRNTKLNSIRNMSYSNDKYGSILRSRFPTTFASEFVDEYDADSNYSIRKNFPSQYMFFGKQKRKPKRKLTPAGAKEFDKSQKDLENKVGKFIKK